jgi:4-hydroxy-4-methyl-2-oxoglutarate aldolase
MPVDPRWFSVLRRFDTPTVLNVIELFDVRPRNEGFLDRRIKACFPRLPPIVGYATTATFRSAEAAGKGDVYSSFTDQVEQFVKEIPAPRIVVFEDLDGEPAAATFGEVMCTVYKAFGCVGLITSGAARDLDQVERIAFPCFASSVIASHGYCRITGVNVPVTVGGVKIEPGAIIHADRNGVAVIPTDLVAETALGCQKLADAENEILHYVSAGSPTVEGLKAAQRRSRDRFAQIPAEVREELSAKTR